MVSNLKTMKVPHSSESYHTYPIIITPSERRVKHSTLFNLNPSVDCYKKGMSFLHDFTMTPMCKDMVPFPFVVPFFYFEPGFLCVASDSVLALTL